MLRYQRAAPAFLLLLTPCCVTRAQRDSVPQPSAFKVIVGSPSSQSATVVAIPPAISWTGNIRFGDAAANISKLADRASWVNMESALNGLAGFSAPWHIVITYEQFDEDGDKVHSGTFEELWAGPKKYRASYKADDLNQTDYATAQGLFRLGDQRWPNRAQVQVSKEVIAPFSYAASLRGVHVGNVTEKFGPHSLDCTVIENGTGGITSPTQYCFSPGAPELRYSRGAGWNQTTYNDVTRFSGRFVAQTVDVYDGGKAYLRLRVQRLEAAVNLADADFAPPSEAKNLSGQRVLPGVAPVPVKPSFPGWPESLRQEHFAVTVEIVIGKDGHVLSAHAISGPPAAFKAAEATARKWTYQPFMVLDEPAEVSTKMTLSNN